MQRFSAPPDAPAAPAARHGLFSRHETKKRPLAGDLCHDLPHAFRPDELLANCPQKAFGSRSNESSLPAMATQARVVAAVALGGLMGSGASAPEFTLNSRASSSRMLAIAVRRAPRASSCALSMPVKTMAAHPASLARARAWASHSPKDIECGSAAKRSACGIAA